MKNSLADVRDYSPVMLYLSSAIRILNENPVQAQLTLRILTWKFNQGTKFGTFKKSMFSFILIIFLFNGIVKQNI